MRRLTPKRRTQQDLTLCHTSDPVSYLSPHFGSILFEEPGDLASSPDK
jgi:hypothetical protein